MEEEEMYWDYIILMKSIWSQCAGSYRGHKCMSLNQKTNCVLFYSSQKQNSRKVEEEQRSRDIFSAEKSNFSVHRKVNLQRVDILQVAYKWN